MTKPAKLLEIDGRRQRSERSKQAIIDAMAAMIEEGNLIPTAQQASDRAGVGIRTVFRHFSDMENLFSIADTQRRAHIEGLFAGGDRHGSVSERIQKLVDYRSEQYELVANIARSSLAQRWRYKALHENYARYQRALHNDNFDWLPELRSLPKALQDSIEAQLSFEHWDRLRDHQNLGADAAKAAIAETLARLLGA